MGRALADAERETVTTPWIIAAIRLLILTGARLSEIRTLRWTEVDFSRRMLRLAPRAPHRRAGILARKVRLGSLGIQHCVRVVSTV